MASKEQLRKIAIYCDSYSEQEYSSLEIKSNSQLNEFASCENCSHFTTDHKCNLGLIDKVLSSLAMEEDLKS